MKTYCSAVKAAEWQPAKRYCSIKEAANETGLSQKSLRRRCHEKTIPFIMEGRKFLINVPKLLAQLEDEENK